MTPPPTEPSNSPGQAALTPLLDTLFLLLFAVLASSDSKAAREDAPQEIQVELPSVEDSGEPSAEESERALILITIEAGGRVQIGDTGASPATAAELAAALVAVESGSSVEIRAHADARHAVVVEVLHGLREAGLLDVRFVAMRHEPGGESRPLGGRSDR
ncbi:MAG: biopolymer transport protein ExbD [Planctomycetota bacterium]|jgi:biopolymer transport protein ExbD